MVEERRSGRDEWAVRGGVEGDCQDSGAVVWMGGHCLEIKNSAEDMLSFRGLRASLRDDK